METQLISPVLRYVGALARSINTHSEMVFRKLELQRGQFIYITRVCENPGINLVELATALCMDKTTVTKAVQKLIVNNWLTKEPDLVDKRILRLYPTAKADQAYSQLIATENCGIRACFAQLTLKEQQQVERLLSKMINGVTDLNDILLEKFNND